MTQKLPNQYFKKIAEEPAYLLDKSIQAGEKLAEALNNHKTVKQLGKYWKNLGPGLTTGAADDDPSGITTYSQAGSRFGYGLLWLSAFTFPFMAIIQEMCARIGMVTGKGLAANIRGNYPKWTLYSITALLFMANSFNIGANLGAMAKATQLIFPSVNFPLLIIFFTFTSLFLQIFTSYKHYSKYLKWLALILLSYIFSALMLDLDGKLLLKFAFLPQFTFNKDMILMICAILGTTISPYLFFWQTSQEVEEEILEGKTTIAMRQNITTNAEIKRMRIDVWFGMFFSNLVMFFIIVTCAVTLFSNGIFDIQTASQAAIALKPFAGNQAYLLFALGIVGTGLLSVPILAGSASYALSEALGWQRGLHRKLNQARAFYGVIIISMLVGLLLNFTNLDPIKALIYSAIINGLVAPVILVLIVQMSSNGKIMGLRKNGLITSIFGWLITLIMILTCVATLASLLFKD